MTKFSEKDWDQFFSTSEGYKKEWERQVVNNRELHIELNDLQYKFRFPRWKEEKKPQRVYLKVAGWMGRRPKKYNELSKAIDELIQKHEIHIRWRTPILYLVMIDRPVGLLFEGGFPCGTYSFDEDGNVKHKINLTSDVDIENLVVRDWIKHYQLKDDPPPQPQPMKDNPRKLDWRPVLEWKIRHPFARHKDIAKILNCHPSTVRKNLAECKTDY